MSDMVIAEKNREYQRKWFSQNKATQSERVKKNREKARTRNRAWLIEYTKAHPCVDCGEKDFVVLDFDHRLPEEKRASVAKMLQGGYSLEAIRAEVAKCDVRCANCHRRKTALRLGWYT